MYWFYRVFFFVLLYTILTKMFVPISGGFAWEGGLEPFPGLSRFTNFSTVFLITTKNWRKIIKIQQNTSTWQTGFSQNRIFIVTQKIIIVGKITISLFACITVFYR
jgi:hypothetical protein